MKYQHFYLIVIILMFWAFLLGFVHGCSAEEVDMNIIAFIESSNNSLAYNAKTNAVGKYQIRIPALKDYNLAHIRNSYSHEDMYNVDKAFLVANWYMNKAIPQYLRAFGIEDTLSNRLAGYNWGVGNLKKHYEIGLEMPKETKDYIVKYNLRRNNG